uniref:Calcified cuticle protein CP19.0 isoform B n=1 Tax=Callinectes sapidus TaxID=6763 RepID=Q2V6U0_CALSI|nr:calcified cuticle protein CP19.0 isoform B [Callinectes sapidus]
MRALVVLAVVGACSAMPFIPDAPDVAAEKARFFQAYQVAHAANLPKASRPSHQAFVPHQAFNQAPVQTPKWMGPLASNVPAGLPGSSAFVADTPEVQAAKNHFLNAYSAQVAATVPVGPRTSQPSFAPRPVFQASAPAPRPQPKWTGPLASQVPAGLPGSSPVLSDTAEVAAAKNAFFHTYSAQVAATAGAPSTRFF